MVIAEVAESSPLDFRLYDWGRKAGEIDPFDAELTLEAAFDFIDYRAWQPSAPRPAAGQGTVRLSDNPEFIATEIRLSEPLHIYCEQFGSFVAYLCLCGEASVQVPAVSASGEKTMDNYVIGAGETLLVPAEVPDFYLAPRAEGTLLLEAVVERHETPGDFAADPDDGRLLN